MFQLHNAVDVVYAINTCFDRRLLAGLLGRELLPSLCFRSFFLFLLVLRIEPRTWWMLGKCSLIGLHAQPFDLFASLLTGPLSLTHSSNCSSFAACSVPGGAAPH